MAAAAAAAGMDAPDGAFVEARSLALGHEAPTRIAPPGEWLLEEAYLKPFAGVRHAHYAAAAALALRARLPPGLPERIEVATYAEALRYAGNRAPRPAIAAQFSLSWAVAAALAQGDLGPGAYTEAALADPDLRTLEARVVLAEDLALTDSGRRGARVTAVLEADALAKFRRLAGPTLGEAGAAQLATSLLEDGPIAGFA